MLEVESASRLGLLATSSVDVCVWQRSLDRTTNRVEAHICYPYGGTMRGDDLDFFCYFFLGFLFLFLFLPSLSFLTYFLTTHFLIPFALSISSLSF